MRARNASSQSLPRPDYGLSDEKSFEGAGQGIEITVEVVLKETQAHCLWVGFGSTPPLPSAKMRKPLPALQREERVREG